MDRRLVAWAHGVKARRDRGRTRRERALPVLFAFIDRRIADPVRLVASLPRGPAARLLAVVLRDPEPGRRAALGTALAPLCRARGLALLVAGDPRLAARLRAGLHLPAGRRSVIRTPAASLRTASAHGPASLRRARIAGARLCFLSPVFATASHPGARPLGLPRFARLAGRAPLDVLALGGIDGASARALPRGVAGAGAIGAFL